MLARVTQLAAKPRREHGAAAARGAAHCAAIALLLLPAACSGGDRGGTPPRDLILVTVDTLRADRLSGMGHTRVTTDLAGLLQVHGEVPESRRSLDRLAAEGVTFARAFAPRGMTFPSISTLFTGRSPLEHGALDNGDLLCESVPTLAEELSRAGFVTAGFVTNQLLVPDSGIARGFEEYFTDFSADRDLRAVSAATEWLIEQDLEEGPPLFLWIHLMGPHMPYDPAELEGVRYGELFTDPVYAGGADGSREFLDTAYRDGRELDATDVEHVRELYDGEVARIDHLVSLFTEVLSGALPEQPVDVLSQSLFVFLADHGEELYQRNRYWAHSKSVYDSVLHVPLFLRHPASLTGRRVMGDLVELQDLLPTILDWFDLPVPAGVRGRSLLPLIDGDPFESRDAFATWRDRVFTVRTEDWRYVWNPDGIEPTDPPEGPYPIPGRALYDVRRDPLERHDVLEGHADVGGQLEARIRSWRATLVPVCESGREIPPWRRKDLQDLGYLDGAEAGQEQSGGGGAGDAGSTGDDR